MTEGDFMEKKFCSQCGTERKKGQQQCAKCGKSFSVFKVTKTWFHILLGLLAIYLIYHAIQPSTEKSSPPPVSTNMTRDINPPSDDPRVELDTIMKMMSDPGNSHEQSDKIARRLSAFTARHPSHGYSLRLLGNLYFDLNHIPDAITTYEKYLDLYPEDANVRVDYATMLLYNNETDRAILNYKKVLDQFPFFLNVHHNLSIAYQQAGDLENADAFKKTAEALKQNNSSVDPKIMDLPKYPR